jgi:hypothetical protein
VLAAPTLTVYKGQGVIHQSNSWGGGAELSAAFVRLGAFPLTSTSADAATLLTLQPGTYTLHVNDPGTAGGVALAEIYDASVTPVAATAPRLVNISARGIISGDHQVTGGFVITGNTARKVLVRGVGPGLPAEVPSRLANPVVTLNHIVSGNGTVIAKNDNWGTPDTVSTSYPAASAAEIAAAATATGAFDLTDGSSDSAVLVTLAPGLYTAQVSSSGGTTGAAMVEIYELP